MSTLLTWIFERKSLIAWTKGSASTWKNKQNGGQVPEFSSAGVSNTWCIDVGGDLYQPRNGHGRDDESALGIGSSSGMFSRATRTVERFVDEHAVRKNHTFAKTGARLEFTTRARSEKESTGAPIASARHRWRDEKFCLDEEALCFVEKVNFTDRSGQEH